MLLTRAINASPYQIRSYVPGCITINTTRYEHSVILSADQLLDPWPPRTLRDLSWAHFEPIMALKPDIVLLGTGSHFIMPESLLLNSFRKHGLQIECMSTYAACSTFMILTAEARHVVAALLVE